MVLLVSKMDRAFWESLGEIRRVPDLSNADIVWFVVDYRGPIGQKYEIVRHQTWFTTLENAVEGLTGGDPVTLEQFEDAIRRKLARHPTR